MSESKIISNLEPIGSYALENNPKIPSPHSVVQVEYILENTAYARCVYSNVWIQFKIPKGLSLKENGYALIQQKDIGKPTQLVKIKDVDQQKKWKTGETYLPNLNDSVVIKPYLIKSA